MIVKPNQSLLDVILQGCGTMEAGLQVATDNALPISYFPEVGSNISISTAAVVLGDNGALKYLAQNGIVIGTKDSLAGDALLTEDGGDIISEGGDILTGES